MKNVKYKLLLLLLCIVLSLSTISLCLKEKAKAQATEVSAVSGGILSFVNSGSENSVITNFSVARFSETSVIYNHPLGFEAVFAKVYGENAFILGNNGTLYEYNLISGSMVNAVYLGISPYSLNYFTVDESGSVYTVASASPSIINKYSGSSLIYSYDTGSNIDHIDSVNGNVYISIPSLLITGSTYGYPEDFTEFPLSCTPAKFLNGQSFISTSGNYVILTDREILMYGGAVIPDKSCTFNSGKQHFYMSEGNLYAHFSGSTVSLGTMWLDNFYSYDYSGNFLALNGNGILMSENGNMVFYPHKDYEEPENEQNYLDTNDGFVYFSADEKVSRLKDDYNMTVYTESGKEASGVLKTGMYTVSGSNEYTVVIIGDSNGTGTVNSSDISEAQKHVIGKTCLEGAYFAAADMDRNGFLDTSDLYLLSKLISEN